MGTNHGVRPRRGRPRDPDAEPRIRRYAVQLLLERGFDGMTVDDVAEAVRRYGLRYRVPGENPERVVMIIKLERMIGNV